MTNLRNHVSSMIIGMVTSGMKHKDIAQRLGIHRNTVRNTVRRFAMTGLTSDLPDITSSSAHLISGIVSKQLLLQQEI